jgi:hypothetical protein
MCPDDRPVPSRPGSRALATRVVATLCGTVAIGIPLLAFELAAVVVFGLRCDDGCGGSGWGDPSAWQWYAQFWGLAIPALVTGAASVLWLARGRPRAAAIALGITCTLAAAWFAFPLLEHALFWGLVIVHPVLQLSGLAYFAGDRSDWPFLAVWLMTIGGAITIGGETVALRRWR